MRHIFIWVFRKLSDNPIGEPIEGCDIFSYEFPENYLIIQSANQLKSVTYFYMSFQKVIWYFDQHTSWRVLVKKATRILMHPFSGITGRQIKNVVGIVISINAPCFYYLPSTNFDKLYFFPLILNRNGDICWYPTISVFFIFNIQLFKYNVYKNNYLFFHYY